MNSFTYDKYSDIKVEPEDQLWSHRETLNSSQTLKPTSNRHVSTDVTWQRPEDPNNCSTSPPKTNPPLDPSTELMMKVCEVSSDEEESNAVSEPNRFNREQISVLVDNWRTFIKKLESSKAPKYWKRIQEEVNKVQGSHKTIQQLKRKMLALKADYKKAKEYNRRHGKTRRSKYYDEIDSVLGTRDVVNIPYAFSSGCPVVIENQPATSSIHATSRLVAFPMINPSELAASAIPFSSGLGASAIPFSSGLGASSSLSSSVNTAPLSPDKSKDDTQDGPPSEKKKKSKNAAVGAVNSTMIEMQKQQQEFTKNFFNGFFERFVAMEERLQDRNNEFLLRLVQAMKK